MVKPMRMQGLFVDLFVGLFPPHFDKMERDAKMGAHLFHHPDRPLPYVIMKQDLDLAAWEMIHPPLEVMEIQAIVQNGWNRCI